MKILALSCALALLVAPSLAQNLVQNGGFDSEPNATQGFVDPSQFTIPSWNFTASSDSSYMYIDSTNDTYDGRDQITGLPIAPENGKYFAEFGAYGSTASVPPVSAFDTLDQQIQTTAGVEYTLSYYVYASDGTNFFASLDGQTIAGTTITNGAYTGQWTKYTTSFVGAGGSQDLKFGGYNGNMEIYLSPSSGPEYWVGLDNISVTAQAAPEPMSMLALGLGAFGLIRRRAKR